MRSGLISRLLVSCAFLLPAAASADILETTSGQRYEGKITSETGAGVTIDTLIAGIRAEITVARRQVKSVEYKPLPEGFWEGKSESQTKKEESEKSKADDKADRNAERRARAERMRAERNAPRYAVIEAHGGIGNEVNNHALEKALGDAKSRRIEYVIFSIDSPGGYLYDAYDMIETLRRYEEDFTYIALIENGGAISAATVFVASAQHIFIRRSGTVGAATAYSTDSSTGAAEVDAKLNSAWAAGLASLAASRGHEPELFRAMAEVPIEIYINKDSGDVRTSNPGGPGWDKVDGDETILTLRADQLDKYCIGTTYAGEPEGLAELIGVEIWRDGGRSVNAAFARAGTERVELEEDFNASLARYKTSMDGYNRAVERANQYRTQNSQRTGYLQTALREVETCMSELGKMAKYLEEAEKTGAQHLTFPPEIGHDVYVTLEQLRADVLNAM
ncbi:MAG: hypothetical protein AAGI17_01125 [Planctomycetota bacterium]